VVVRCAVRRALIPRCKTVELYFANSTVIDDINALRQGHLQLENHWPTRDGWFRIYTTIIGMVITDAFQISQRTKAGPKGASIKSFANHLAGTALKPLTGRKRRSSCPDDGQGWGAHQPRRIEKKARAAPPASGGGATAKPPKHNTGKVQLRCKVCGRKTTNCCEWCDWGAVCSPDSSARRGGCWEKHLYEAVVDLSHSGDVVTVIE
jgi:hypothetical protein